MPRPPQRFPTKKLSDQQPQNKVLPPSKSSPIQGFAREPLFKIAYKNAGFAESVRMACQIGDVPYEDAIMDDETWARLRHPSGPVMVVDGRRVRHHQTILRFIGKLANMYPTNPVDALLVDDVLDRMRELRIMLASEKVDGDIAERQRRVFDSGILHDVLATLEHQIATNGTGFFCGDKLSIADLEIATLANWISRGTLEGIPRDILGEFPELIKIQQTVLQYAADEKALMNKKKAASICGQRSENW